MPRRLWSSGSSRCEEVSTVTRKKMIAYYLWLLNQGDHEAAKEVEYDFFDLWGESIFDYI